MYWTMSLRRIKHCVDAQMPFTPRRFLPFAFIGRGLVTANILDELVGNFDDSKTSPIFRGVYLWFESSSFIKG
ncbi:hypothetical protein A6U92_16550 [Agrobacterium rubi]|nr:hypothetical protein A6U92_16550 [Agrobacterium rubi]